MARHPRVRGVDAPVGEQVVRAELHLRHRRREDALRLEGLNGGRGEAPVLGQGRRLHGRLRRPRLRPVVAGVREGHGRVPDQRQLADSRPEEGARQERGLLPPAATEGQAARDARRRGAAVGDQLEVRQRRRGGDVPQLHHEQRLDAGRRKRGAAHRLEGEGARAVGPRHRGLPRMDEGERQGRDRSVPRLGDADDVRHGHGGDSEADGGQGHSVVLREDRPVRLREVPLELSRLAEQGTEPVSAPRGLRRPARLGGGDVGAARVEPPGAPGRVGYLYLLPALAVYAAFVLAPLGHTIWLSLHQWDGLTPATWVGLDNYREILHDGELRSAFEHSFVLIFFYAVIPVTLALVLVGALSRAQVRGQAGFRTVLFLPQVIPLVVVAVIWRMIYAPDGPLNSALDAIGLGSLARPWLGGFTWAAPVVRFLR